MDGSWSSTNNLEYWNKGNTATTVNNNTVHKTIYSPSPSSYSEQKSAACTGFTTTGVNENVSTPSLFNVNGLFNKGWNFYCQPRATESAVFFSALGFRDVYSNRVNASNGGIVAYFGEYGGYWSVDPSSTLSYARILYFSLGNVYPQYEAGLACGFTVRSTLE